MHEGLWSYTFLLIG
uniref:Uncharacterized protein n=1 Tax=Anguilla anguilla TaxID=7936 RepID=A0A0E9TE42_ANGAN